MASEQFSLCWDNFHVNMSSGMHSLLEKEDLVDVTLAIEGQYLKAHKMVLSVCSPYFRKLFSTNPCKHPIFFMKDVTYEVMNDLLTFMYQGEVQVNQENLATFIKTAEALQIKGLTGENREVDDALKEVNSLKRPPPFPDEPRNRLNRSKPNSSKKMKTAQESPELQRDDSYIEQTSDAMQLKVEPNEQVEDAESYGWPDDSYLNETENLPDDSQVDEAEECHMMEEEPKAGTSLEGAIPNQEPKIRKTGNGRCHICPRKDDRRTRKCCTQCNKWICKDHQEEIAIICSRCIFVAAGLIGAAQPTISQNERIKAFLPHKKFVVPPEVRYTQNVHMPIYGNSLRCNLCSTRAQPHRTKWQCATCRVGLCLSDKKNCFMQYHSI